MRIIIGCGLCIFTQNISVYTAATFIPVAALDAIRLTTALISGIILFSIFLDERSTILRIFNGFVCTVGIFCVTQPNLMFQKKDFEVTFKNASISIMDDNKDDGVESAIFHYCLPVITGIALSGSVVFFKRSTYMNEHIIKVLLWIYLQSGVPFSHLYGCTRETCITQNML